jgi:hypothetical protein
MVCRDLLEAVTRLTAEIETFNLVLKDFHACFKWAVDHDRLTAMPPYDDEEEEAEEDIEVPSLETILSFVRERERLRSFVVEVGPDRPA